MTAHDFAAKNLANGLVPKANAHKRRFRLRRGFGQRQADTSLRWVARARRQHDHLGLEGHGLLNVQCIIAVNHNVRPQFAEVVHKIVGKAVVVIDQKEHRKGSPVVK